MRTRTIAVAAALALVGLTAHASGWEETDWGTEIVVDGGGRPAVVFFVSLEAAATPDGRSVSASWEVYEVVDGAEVRLGGFSRSAVRSGESARIHSASPTVPIEAGGRYGARVAISGASGVTVLARTFEFVAPPALPFGIRLSGWDGSENVDLGGLPDEELEELALLHDLLDGYTRAAEGVSIDAFLRGDAATSDYPLSLLLLPTADIDTSSAPITLYVILNLYVYTLSDPTETASVRGQIAQFEQDLIGSVYTGTGSAILGGGRTIFVHDSAWPVLEAAASEVAAR